MKHYQNISLVVNKAVGPLFFGDFRGKEVRFDG